jgi:HD-GYP domain-containing protein (c-di-GMP phosphodiesterase class II)
VGYTSQHRACAATYTHPGRFPQTADTHTWYAFMTPASFADFIDHELAALEAYDAQRSAGHVYEFHLHSRRVAESMRDLAQAMDLGHARAEALYQASLVHDIGKRLLPIGIWDAEGKPTAEMKAQRRQHTTLGVQIVDETFGADNHNPFVFLMRDLMQNHHECMDGSGWLGKTGRDLSLEARMLCICDAFDGYSIRRPHFGDRDTSPQAVIQRMVLEKAGQFDPEIIIVFSETKLGSKARAQSHDLARNAP